VFRGWKSISDGVQKIDEVTDVDLRRFQFQEPCRYCSTPRGRTG
jgi:hypothetical protein